MFCLAHGDRTVARNFLRRRQRLIEELVRLANSVDHAPFHRIVGRERRTAQDQLLGPALAKRTRQVLVPAATRNDPERRLGQGELSQQDA